MDEHTKATAEKFIEEFDRWKVGTNRELEIFYGVSLALMAADQGMAEEETLMLGGLGKLIDRVVTEAWNAISYADHFVDLLKANGADEAAK
jgi:hypothetical protein